MKRYEKYNLQRDRALRERQLRMQQACESAPELEGLLTQKRELFAARGLAVARGESVSAVDGEIAQINERIGSALEAAGFARDYIEHRPICPLCNDSGFVGGKACSCGDVVEHALTFANFDIERFPEGEQRKRAQRLFDVAHKYVAEYPAVQRSNLLLIGTTGLGKTHALRCLAGELRAKGARVEIVTAYELIQTIMDEVFTRRDYGYMRRMEGVDVLVLDDLGTEPMIPNVTIEFMFGLLNERSIRGKPTLIATNLMSGDLRTRYGERITSRLFDREKTLAMELVGVDLRTHRL